MDVLLIIDDEMLLAKSWQRKLAGQMQVMWFDNPYDGLELKNKDDIDLIIIDRFFDQLGIDIVGDKIIDEYRSKFSCPIILSTLSRVSPSAQGHFDGIIPKKPLSYEQIMTFLPSAAQLNSLPDDDQ